MNIIFRQAKVLGARLLQRIFGQQKLTLKRGLVAALVGVSLWSVGAPAQAADADDYYQNERGAVQSTERYDTIQSKTGDFNNFEDVDPRRNTQAAEAKAQTLTDSAERRQRVADSDPLESARDAVGNIKNKIDQTAEDVSDSIRN